LKLQLLQQWPDLTRSKNHWRRRAFGGRPVGGDNLAEDQPELSSGLEVTRFCGEQYGWDGVDDCLQTGGQPATQGVEITSTDVTAGAGRTENPPRGAMPRGTGWSPSRAAELRPRASRARVRHVRPRAREPRRTEPAESGLLKQWGYSGCGEGGGSGEDAPPSVFCCTLVRAPAGEQACGRQRGYRAGPGVDSARHRRASCTRGWRAFLYVNLLGRQQ